MPALQLLALTADHRTQPGAWAGRELTPLGEGAGANSFARGRDQKAAAERPRVSSAPGPYLRTFFASLSPQTAAHDSPRSSNSLEGVRTGTWKWGVGEEGQELRSERQGRPWSDQRLSGRTTRTSGRSRQRKGPGARGTAPASGGTGEPPTPPPSEPPACPLRRPRQRPDIAASAPEPRRAAPSPRRAPGPATPAARSHPSYLARGGSGGGDNGAAPHVPVPHFPVRHAAVRPHRAAATAASRPRPHRPSSTGDEAGSVGGGGGGGGGSKSRSTPHPPPRNRKWLQPRRQFPAGPSRGGGADSPEDPGGERRGGDELRTDAGLRGR